MGMTMLGDELCRPSNLTSHPAHRRDQLRHRVLRRDRIVEDHRVQRPLVPTRQHPGRVDHTPDRVEDPLRLRRIPKPVAPVRQRRRVQTLMIQRQTAGDLPPKITTQRLRRVPIRQTLQRLQHQHRRDHLARHTRPPPARPEQISEHPIREHLPPVLSQERIHRPSRHQMTHQRLSVQQHPIRA